MLVSLWDKWTTPNHLIIAQRQLAEARCKLMEAEATASYAGLMIQYYSGMVARHEQLLVASNSPQSKNTPYTEETPMKK